MPKQTDSIELTNVLQGTVEYTASKEIIPEEKILQQGEFSYDENGTYTENPSEGYDGFSNVETTVDVQPNLQSKSVSYTENNDYTISPDDGYQGLSSVAVTVDVPQGGGEAPENDVEFIDYDGTIVYSYTAEQFLALDAMPANPTHEGLTAQGWNWTLADAKEFVTANGGLVIGQVYDTPDGSMNIYVSLPEGFLSPYLGICPNGTAVIDWGDGSPTDTLTGTSLYVLAQIQHTYASAGNYKINVKMQDSGTMGLYGVQYGSCYLLRSVINPSNSDLRYQAFITHLNVGSQVTYEGSRAFAELINLETVTTVSMTQAEGLFSASYTLRCMVIPPNETNAITDYMFNLSGITRISMPKNVGSIYNYAFHYSNLKKIHLNNNTDVSSQSGFQYCEALETVITNKGLGGSSCFIYCTNLKKITKPYVNGSNAFQYCYRLTKIASVGTSVGQYAYSNCRMLGEVILFSAITSIGAYAFASCTNLQKIRFERETPPTVSNSNTFNSLPTTCKIYVPYSEDHSVLNAYKTATNYPNPSTYTYVEY